MTPLSLVPEIAAYRGISFQDIDAMAGRSRPKQISGQKLAR
jgi:hypothetical protein